MTKRALAAAALLLAGTFAAGPYDPICTTPKCINPPAGIINCPPPVAPAEGGKPNC